MTAPAPERREAHGFTYEDDWRDDSLMCRNGCGRSYPDVSSGKVRECRATGHDPRCLYCEHGPYCLTCPPPASIPDDAYVCGRCREGITRSEIAADPYYRGEELL